jgi:preprotein translocase subunit SecF
MSETKEKQNEETTQEATPAATGQEKKPLTRQKRKAWMALDPFNNPNAPPGPLFMPQYKLSLDEQANQLDAEAEKTFKVSQAANQQSDNYVLNAVFLASVLFLTAIAERFEWNTVRAVVLALALGMLLFGLYHLFTYPIN